MDKELKKIDFWISGPNFENYKVSAFHIFEAAAIAIRENKPKSLGVAIHAWGGEINRYDFILLSVAHLVENYNLGNLYFDNSKERRPVKTTPWYKRLFATKAKTIPA